ncbi:MAG: ferredoxin family protein [Polyangiales bacterium]
MIELVSQERCIECDICVDACPTDVFDRVPDAPPVIARKHDCQTCFMCEAYCPADALFVSPNADAAVGVSEAELEARGLLGSYRQSINWNKQRPVLPSDEDERLRHEFRKLNALRLSSGR